MTLSYPKDIWQRYGQPATWCYSNIATASDTLANMISEEPTELYPRLLAGRRGIAIIWGGTNDMGLNPVQTPATTYSRLKTWIANAKAAGYAKVVAVTCLPRATGANGNFETDRQSYNTLIRNGQADLGYDALADVAADSNIGPANANTNLTYYQADQVHVNDTGRAIVSTIVKAALDTVV